MCDPVTGAIITSAIMAGGQVGSAAISKKKGGGAGQVGTPLAPSPNFFPGGPIASAGLPTRGTSPTFPGNPTYQPPGYPQSEDEYLKMFKPRIYDEAFAGGY